MSGATNSRGALGVRGDGRTWGEARRAEMAALDQLPAGLRMMVRENATNVAVVSVLAFYRSILRQVQNPATAATVTARKLAVYEAAEISAFAGQFQACHRLPLPHVAAGASVLRSGSGRPGRRARLPMIRGFGLPDVPEVSP